MSNPQNDPDLAKAERKARRFWVSLVVTFLGLQVVIGVMSVRLAIGDSAAVIVPDYHTTALNWDAHRRRQTAADRLGIKVVVKPSEIADGQGNRAIEVLVSDRDSKAMTGVVLSGRLYHHAAAGDAVKVSFEDAGDGRHVSLAPMAKPGSWHLELKIDGADEPIVLPVTVEVAS